MEWGLSISNKASPFICVVFESFWCTVVIAITMSAPLRPFDVLMPLLTLPLSPSAKTWASISQCRLKEYM